MEKLIETIVGAIQDKKGKDIVSLDLSGFDGAICSHFVVCNADSTMQVAAIADGVEEAVVDLDAGTAVAKLAREVPDEVLKAAVELGHQESADEVTAGLSPHG